MSLNLIRYQQQYQQVNSALKPGVGNVTTYVTRDPLTGMRVVEAADGSRQLAQYISNSKPDGTIALTVASSIGLTGYISQKPY